MPNKIYQDIVKLDIASIKGESNAINTIKHNGIKGNIREHGLGRILLKYLPFGWDIGNGQINDSEGAQSNETDLIIFHKAGISPLLFGNSLGLFPIESCAYAIEVKTKSTANEIKTTIQKFKNLQTLSAKCDTRYNPLRVYFAYNSNLTRKSELQRYKEQDDNFHTNPAIHVICILGKGYWYFQREETRSYWRFIKAYDDNYEVMAFLSGIINTLQGDDNLAIGEYLLTDKRPFENIEHHQL